MFKNKWLALFVMASFLSSLIIPKASAEVPFQAEKFPFSSMQVQVMPEFDYPQDWPSRNTPSLLVGLYGTITNKSGQDYDGKIEIPVPAGDKGFEANLVAEFPDPNKPEVQRPYEIDKQNGIVSWKPGTAIKNNATYKFVIEYYTQTINVKDKKSFTYQLTNKASIDQLNVIFYAPMDAKEIQLQPQTQNSEKSEYGEQLYYYQYQNVKAGSTLKYNFSYKKDGTESTLEAINKQQPPNDSTHAGLKNGSTANSSKTSASQPIIGIGGASIIGIAIIIAGLFVYFGLKGKGQQPVGATKQIKEQPKNAASPKKNNKSANTEAKKELRKKLLTGKIDQETYEEEMKKLI
jgi:hypothetical protein